MRHDTPLKDRAQGHWQTILPQFGVDSRHLDGKHHPCPLCGGKDRWRFDDLQGQGTSICGQCGARTGMQLVMDMKGWAFAQMAVEVEKIIGTDPAPPQPAKPQKDAAEKFAEAQGYWRSGVRIVDGDPVDLYLRRRVGIYQPTRALKFIPATPFSGTTYPAMVSAYVDVHGDLAGVQRTFLTQDGRKAGLEPDRWNTGALPDGGAIRLAKHDKVLGIAEGIETALSAARLYGLPVWAALNENRLEVWQPPEGVNEIVVFGDADMNCVGQAAAYALGKRLSRDKTRTVQVMIPPDLGTDWNDVLRQRQEKAA
jgi:putative DNA primase/helicase